MEAFEKTSDLFPIAVISSNAYPLWEVGRIRISIHEILKFIKDIIACKKVTKRIGPIYSIPDRKHLPTLKKIGDLLRIM